MFHALGLGPLSEGVAVRRHLLVVLLALGLLGGCGKEPPTAAPSGDASTPVVTPSSTPTAAPVLPEQAKGNTKAGAIAFVRHYVDVVNFAIETGRTGDLANLSHKSCGSCDRLIENVSKVYAGGGWITGGTCRTSRAWAGPIDSANWLVKVRCTYADQVTHHAGGSVAESKGLARVFQFVVQYRPVRKVTSWSRT